MALPIFFDRIKETTTTTGTGTITLAGAVTGYRSFADVGNGNETYYVIEHQSANEWEVGIGTYTSSGTTLSRTTILRNHSGGTSAITLSAGTKNVFLADPAAFLNAPVEIQDDGSPQGEVRTINFTTNITASVSGTVATVSATGGGSLVYFVEAQDVGSPNDTIRANSLTAIDPSFTDVDVSYVAKGAGATLAQVPDNTSTGGNKRGQRATDWQKSRANADQVASGIYSVVGGGQSNSATGSSAVVGGGNGNDASYDSSTVGGGQDNTVNAPWGTIVGGIVNNINTGGSGGFIGGGSSNLVGGSSAVVGGGQFNEATGGWSLVGGGLSNRSSAVYASIVGGNTNNNNIAASFSVIGGGSQNTNTAPFCGVFGGFGNSGAAEGAFVGGGSGNQARQIYCTIGGGNANLTSGFFCTIGGGTNNTILNSIASTIAGGTTNTINQNTSYSIIGGGTTNKIWDEAQTGFIGGGANNEIGGSLSSSMFLAASYAVVAGGQANRSRASWSFIGGGKYAIARYAGEFAQAAGRFDGTDGTGQTCVYALYGVTDTDTPLALSVDSTTMTLPTDDIWAFSILVTGGSIDTDDAAAYEIKGLVSAVGTPAIIGSLSKTILAETVGGWDADVTIDGGGVLSITVTGDNDNEIRWMARLTTVQINCG